MTDALIRELRALCANGLTGTITLHIYQGAVKQYEVLERRRPKTDDGRVDLTEVDGNGLDSGMDG